MSKNTRWDIKDFQKLGLIEVDGKFVPASSQVDPKPVKIEPGAMLRKPIMVTDHKFDIPAKRQLEMLSEQGFLFVNGNTKNSGYDEVTLNLTVDRRDMEQVAKEYLANLNQKATKKAVVEAIKQIRIQEAEDFLMHHRGANCFYIPGTVRSSKNSKQIFKKKGKDGAGDRMFIGKSFAAIKHEKETSFPYKQLSLAFQQATKDMPLPLFLKFTFIMATDSPFDYNNICQICLDQMQKYEWVRNDNRHNVVPVFNPITYINPEKTGVVIEIL